MTENFSADIVKAKQNAKGRYDYRCGNRTKWFMTDFDKIKEYYSVFDEQNRLIRDNSGKLEYEMTMRILEKHLPEEGTILDLGGGAGVYAFPLAKKGYKVYLADLSERLIGQAKERKEVEKTENLVACDVVNAMDLSIYQDNMFDVVIALGPFYHLTEEDERRKCVSEIRRVLKDGGTVIAGFIPYLSGSIAIVDRYFFCPAHVNASNLSHVFETGKFHNLASNGFQEGYYATAAEMKQLFEDNGFETTCIRSIRGFAYEKEDMIYGVKDEDVLAEIMKAIDKTADDPAVVEMCGHAVYFGK